MKKNKNKKVSTIPTNQKQKKDKNKTRDFSRYNSAAIYKNSYYHK